MKRYRFAYWFMGALFVVVSFGAGARAAEPQVLKGLADSSTVFAESTSVKVSGEVLQVINWHYTEINNDPSHAIMLKLKGADGEFLAYMGPKRYMDNAGYVFTPGEQMEIEGVVAIVKGERMILSKNFSVAGNSHQLRDEKGGMVSSLR